MPALSPPLGIGYFISCAIGKVPPSEAMRPIWPYLGALLGELGDSLEVQTVAFVNPVRHVEIDVMAATLYTYRVKAVNAAGESLSNEATIQIP